MTGEKIHRVLELKQLQWLKPYIASGTYNKLMNVKNIFLTQLATVFLSKQLKTRERYLICQGRPLIPTFTRSIIISDHLIAIKGKNILLLNKPINKCNG